MPKVLARNWKIYIETATADEFQKIEGINSFTLGNEAENTDQTDFDSNGNAEHVVSQRSRTVSFEGFYREDSTGTRDAGQELVEQLADKVGSSSIGTFRFKSPNGSITEVNASAAIGDVGGGNTDSTSWGAELTVSGPKTSIDPSNDTATYVE